MTKPTEDLKIAKPEQPTLVPEHSEAQEDPAINVRPDLPEPFVDETILDPSTVEPSSSANPPETHGNYVLITGTRFIEPGNPIVLVRHFAKQEVMERHKTRFDVSHYAHLSFSEVLSGYLSQVHSSRDSKIEMVKQMHQKYEVRSPAYISYIPCQPPSVLIMIRLNDL